MKLKVSLIIVLAIHCLSVYTQELVNFNASDNLKITADLYETEKESDKWMIMVHQAEFSRGEFKEAARRMIKVGYNCLAVDLRSGGEVNFVQNETAALAKELGYPKNKNAQITLFGSSFSASFCLKLAKERNDLTCVIAFSPGEFFEPAFSVKQAISGLQLPVYIGCAKSEFEYVKELASLISSKKKVIFKPERGEGLHGSKTLWWESPTRDEFWLSLLFFLNGLNKI